MDKVIINGVDISECKHFWQEKGLNLCRKNFDNNYFSNGLPCAKKCETHHDCYYKQLKRLERQYEDVLKLAKENADSNEYCLQELEQENEQLKKEVETWNYQADKRAELSNIWFNTAETYKQALQEIRDIANTIYNTNCNYIAESHKIIDKINEVIK